MKHKPKESYSNGVNKIIRVSSKFNSRLDNIDKKRKENGLDKISHPKKTDLIIRHKSWAKIEEDVILFNTNLEDKNKK